MSAKHSFLEQYEFIKRELHLTNSDLKLKNNYSSPILFGLLSGVLNSKILFVGEYGLGKTSLAETISSIHTNTPIKSVREQSLKGHPELTYEEIIGRPDLGKLNLGEEKVIWSNFVKSKFKVIDEVNRIPEHKQNILLTGLQSSSWQYLNETFENDEIGVIATTNYSDSANNEIIPPLMDRFDLRVEVKSPNVNIARIIRTKQENLYEQIKAKGKTTSEVEDNFRKEVRRIYGHELITRDESEFLKEEIYKTSFSQEANLYMDVIVSELSSCQVFGNKRKNDECPPGCHYSNYACNKIVSPMSVRTIKSITNYSKAVAYLEGESEVKPMHLSKVLPFAINHKLGVSSNEDFDERREDNKETHYFKKITKEIEQRFYQIKNKQEEFVTSILRNDYSKAKSIAREIEHPVFLEYLK